MEENRFYVYRWTNLLDGKQYVGKGTGQRAWEHVTKPNRSGLLGRAIQKHGLGNFRLDLVEGCLSAEQAYALEIKTVTETGCIFPHGYNLTNGGEGVLNPSSETREKLAANKRGKPSPCKGVPRSPETRAKIAAAHRGKSVDPEHLAKLQAGDKAAKAARSKLPPSLHPTICFLRVMGASYEQILEWMDTRSIVALTQILQANGLARKYRPRVR